MPWKRMLAYITGSVNEDLLRRIEYLLEENRVLRNQLDRRLLLTDHERRTLAEKAVALGKLMADTVIREYLAHYHAERNHQGLENVIPFPDGRLVERDGAVVKAERLGGLLNFYYRHAA
jgi:hypothetical protein